MVASGKVTGEILLDVCPIRVFLDGVLVMVARVKVTVEILIDVCPVRVPHQDLEPHSEARGVRGRCDADTARLQGSANFLENRFRGMYQVLYYVCEKNAINGPFLKRNVLASYVAEVPLHACELHVLNSRLPSSSERIDRDGTHA